MTKRESFELSPATAPSVIDLLTDYFDVGRQPSKKVVTKESLMAGAWSATGKHLKVALTSYGSKAKG